MEQPLLDVVIVGGGPAGLAAALLLGRCRRRVVVIDGGEQRNRASEGIHGYLTRDGMPPSAFLAASRREVTKYGVEFREGCVGDARKIDGRFEVELRGGAALVSRRLILATGLRDVLPSIRGIERFYGRSVHHCPYCDGWEHRDQRLVAVGAGNPGLGLALLLRCWSRDVTACIGSLEPRNELVGRAERAGVKIIREEVVELDGKDGSLRSALLASGEKIPCDALFFNTGQVQRSDLPKRLGCEFKDDGGVQTYERQRTCVEGLFVVGDAEKDVQFVAVAAAEGLAAAITINRELEEEDFK